MSTWQPSDIKKQWERVLRLSWYPYFVEAGKAFNFPPSLLMAIGSRETNLDAKYLRIKGDKGYGHGLMQIDKRSYAEWCSSDRWQVAKECILKGASVLDEKLKEVQKHKHPIAIAEQLRIAIAAYNCGTSRALKNYMSAPETNNVDASTTGKNYSFDVLNRQKIFSELEAEFLCQTKPM